MFSSKDGEETAKVVSSMKAWARSRAKALSEVGDSSSIVSRMSAA
jgi:hypothetical protein